MAIMLGGCASGLRRTGQTGLLQPGDLVDLKTGHNLALSDLVEALAPARVVFIGEIHDHPQGHQAQLDLLQELYKKDHHMVIGLELFERPDQPLLDRWTAGEIDRGAFLASVEGAILSPAIYRVYEPLLLWAADRGIPLLALNAPRKVVSRVAAEGLDALEEGQRSAIAREILVGPKAYKKRVTRALPHHHGFSPDNFFTAQVVWDETMSETLTDYLSGPQGRGRKAVVIAGNEHVWNGYGLPDRTARRMSVPMAAVIMPQADDEDVIGPGTADFAWVLPPKPARSTGRLGIEMAVRKENRLVIDTVAPGSPAQDIGLKPGDRLAMMNQKELSRPMDLHRAAMEVDRGTEHTLVVERDGKMIEFHFHFRQN